MGAGFSILQKETEETTMRDFSIDLIWAKIQIAITAIGGWLGYFLGGMDGLMIALIVLMTLDYVSGVMCAIIDRKLSSAVGFKGVCKKVFILMLVGVAHIIDLHVVGTGSALRGAVICFYMSNEGLSLLENAAHIGLPIPDKLRDILAQLHDKERTTDQGDGE
jgi:toxin secretion/phage lysis holin